MNTYVYVPPRKSLLAFGVMCALFGVGAVGRALGSPNPTRRR